MMISARQTAGCAAVGIALALVTSVCFADDAKIKADNCSIAAGHDVKGNTVTCNFGLTNEQLKQLTQAAVTGATGPLLDRIQILSGRLGVTEDATKTLLKLVGEQPDIPDEDLGKALAKVATDYKRLQAQVAAISTESPLDRSKRRPR